MPISPVDVFVTEEVFGSTFPATRKGYPGRTVGWWPFDNPGSGSSCTRSDELCTLPAELCEIPTSRVIGLSCPPRAEDSDTCPANLLKPFVRGNCRKHDFRVRRQALMIDQHDPVCYGQTWNYTLQNDACFVSSIATTLYDGSIPQANDDFTEGDGHHPTSFIEECHQYDPGSVCSASSKTCRPSTAPANNGIRQVMNENEYNMLTAKEAVMLQVQAYLTGDFTGYKNENYEHRALTLVPPSRPSTGSKILEWVIKGTIDSDKVFSSVVAFRNALKFASLKILEGFPAAAGTFLTELAEFGAMTGGPGMAICAVIGLALVNLVEEKSPEEEYAKMIERATNYIVQAMEANFRQLHEWMQQHEIEQHFKEVMHKVSAIRADFDLSVARHLKINHRAEHVRRKRPPRRFRRSTYLVPAFRAHRC